MNKVIVVGGGAAGLLAAVAAAEHGAQVTVLEKMFKPGKKLLITGKGRCNITNDCDLQEIIKNIPGNGRFLNMHHVFQLFLSSFCNDSRKRVFLLHEFLVFLAEFFLRSL